MLSQLCFKLVLWPKMPNLLTLEPVQQRQPSIPKPKPKYLTGQMTDQSFSNVNNLIYG